MGQKCGKEMQNPVYRVYYMSNLQCAEQRIPSKAFRTTIPSKHTEFALHTEQATRGSSCMSPSLTCAEFTPHAELIAPRGGISRDHFFELHITKILSATYRAARIKAPK
jgi:hypothetical protein